MADRLIVLRDLADALATAGALGVREGAQVAELRLDLLAIAQPPSAVADIWAMRLRHRQGRFGGLASLLRRLRRRPTRGWSVESLTLRWVPFNVTASLGGERLGQLDFGQIQTGEKG